MGRSNNRAFLALIRRKNKTRLMPRSVAPGWTLHDTLAQTASPYGSDNAIRVGTIFPLVATSPRPESSRLRDRLLCGLSSPAGVKTRFLVSDRESEN